MNKLEEMGEFLSRWKNCEKCELAKTRNSIVFGDGSLRDGTIMVAAEAPGVTEDNTGVAFTGVSGELLMEMLMNLNLDRPEIAKFEANKNRAIDFPGLREALCSYYYFTNILKCHPPDNADPGAKQISACREKLIAEIYIVDPTMIIAVGKTAFQVLTGGRKGITSSRGRTCFARIPSRLPGWPPLQYRVMPIYHPAFLLRRADFNTKGHSKGTGETTFDDLKLAHKITDLYNNLNYGMPIPNREI